MSFSGYEKTGLFFAFSLSLVYLPLLLSMADLNSIFFVLIPISIILFTILNYSYIIFIKHYKVRLLNPILLPVINLFLLFYLPELDFIRVEGNVFAFSIIFLFIPWVVIFIIFWVKHIASLGNIMDR